MWVVDGCLPDGRDYASFFSAQNLPHYCQAHIGLIFLFTSSLRSHTTWLRFLLWASVPGSVFDQPSFNNPWESFSLCNPLLLSESPIAVVVMCGGKDVISGVLEWGLRVLSEPVPPGCPYSQGLLSFVLFSFLPPPPPLLLVGETGRLEGTRAGISLLLSIGLLQNPSRLGSGEIVFLESRTC